MRIWKLTAARMGHAISPVTGAARHMELYITPYGERYHSDQGCSALAAYVREVPKSQVEHLGPCSYCGGGK